MPKHDFANDLRSSIHVSHGRRQAQAIQGEEVLYP